MYKCKIQNCPTMLKHKTNCKKHWRQIYTHGAPMQTNFDSRPAIAEGDHYKIPLGLNAVNGHTLVDKEYKYLDTHKWNLSGTGYATASIKGRVVRLHRLIKDAPSGKQVDHINNNRLDNRVKNLRLCLNAENGRNRSKTKIPTPKTKNMARPPMLSSRMPPMNPLAAEPKPKLTAPNNPCAVDFNPSGAFSSAYETPASHIFFTGFKLGLDERHYFSLFTFYFIRVRSER